MNVIITMAGEGSRFRKIGINLPKHEIVAKGKTLFQWSMAGLSAFFKNNNFTFISRVGTNALILAQAKAIGIQHCQVIEIDYLTKGQAETTMLALANCDENEPILIFNIDTHLNLSEQELNQELMQGYDGWLQTFKAPGDHWSFAAVNEQNQVVAVSEKKRISDFASTGLYYFRSAELFKTLFEKYKTAVQQQYGEMYIAPLYQYLINEGGKVGHYCISYEKVVPLGTPEEVARFDQQFAANLKA